MPSDEAGGQRPILGTPDDLPERPAGRRPVLAYIVIAVIVAAIAGGWGYVMLAAGGNPQVNAEVVSFDVGAPDSATVTFVVHKPADRAATCRVRALDGHHLEVGSRDVNATPGRSDLRFDERLRTSSQATTVQVDYCDLV
ncbi:DUF4307 domain-containing protein [Microbispora sp. NPDC049125]|uniref:DUF4307 domain-containing protein n=1 Tax=Microbispora sp. NPDC049125 TaxID=3154929 RepID=UPI003467ACAA